MYNRITELSEILQELMKRYKERVPDVQKIIRLMVEHNIIQNESDIENDHIAFRTLGVPHLGVASLEKIFLHYGYEKRDYYFFPEKKLNAWWFSPPEEKLPRIFISELRVGDLSSSAQQLIHHYTDSLTSDPVDNLDLNNITQVDQYLHSSSWDIPTLKDYQMLALESEYAAWAIYNRYYLNHFTLSVHNLKKRYNTLEAFNQFLESNGIVLNDSGGKIKRSPDGLLLQSSTVAEKVEASFANGEKAMIPGSYVEFAERKILLQFQHIPENEILRIHRREGFEAANADRIFESTYAAQVNRKI